MRALTEDVKMEFLLLLLEPLASLQGSVEVLRGTNPQAPQGPSVSSRSPASRDCGQQGPRHYVNPNGVDPAGA
jgi:hypothetical protein